MVPDSRPTARRGAAALLAAAALPLGLLAAPGAGAAGVASSAGDRASSPVSLSRIDGWTTSRRYSDAPTPCASVLLGGEQLRSAQRSSAGVYDSWRAVYVADTRREYRRFLGVDDVPVRCVGAKTEDGQRVTTPAVRSTRVAGLPARLVSVPTDDLGGADYLLVRDGRHLWVGATETNVERLRPFARATLMRRLYALDRFPNARYARARAAWIDAASRPSATADQAVRRAARILRSTPGPRFDARVEQLREFAALPATSLTPQQQRRARTLIYRLNAFFWSPGQFS